METKKATISKINVVIDCKDAGIMARFYSQLLNWEWTHLHIRYSGDWDEPYFRDYLLAHPDTANAYGELKVKLQKLYEHDRDGYTDAKTDFIREITNRAKEQITYPTNME